MSSAAGLGAYSPGARLPGANEQGSSSVIPQRAFAASSLSRLIVQAPPREWRERVEKKLQELVSLPIGWDGYNAQPVSFETASFALRMLESILPSGAPVPQLIPGVAGDIQIEWHTAVGDIELHVRRPNSVHAWRMTASTGEDGEESELTFDFRHILSWIRQLPEASDDAEAAAA